MSGFLRLRSMISSSLFALSLVFSSSISSADDANGVFFDVQVPNWNPSSQEVIVGIQAKLPNNCSFIEGIDSVISNSPVNGLIELNIYVEIMDVPFNIEPEFAKEIGCENGDFYVLEKINFGVLEPGSYIVQVIENNVVSAAKKIHVSKFPLNPDFVEPGGYYNIGDAIKLEELNLLGSL